MKRIITSSALVTSVASLILAAPAFAVNLATCTTAEECGITPTPVETFAPSGGVTGIGASDLIKLANDNDPATHEDEAVYYLDKDWFRRPFPNQAVYKSWYPDFSGVKELSREEMTRFRLGKPITYRPGTRLVKIPSVPRVYAVEPNGSLRWIETEAVAIALYGADWSKRVDDLSETFFIDYKEGVPLAASVWPTGTVVRRTEDGSLFLVDGFGRRSITAEALAHMHLNAAHAVNAPAAVIDAYADLGNIVPGERRFTDTAQQDYLETLPPPHFDVPEAAREASREGTAGGEVTLARLRVIVGEPIIIRRLPVRVTGSGLADVHMTDDKGNDLFGIQQPTGAGTEGETFTFSGAYTIEDAGVTYVELRAKLSASAAGTSYAVLFDRAGMTVADGGNGDVLPRFTPAGAFAGTTFTLR